MRILIGADTYPPTINGAAQATRRLARGLAARGHTVHVACPSTTGEPGTLTGEQGVVIHRIRSLRYPGCPDFPLSSPRGLRRVARRLIDDVEPDVLHVQSGYLLGRALMDAAAARGIGAVATNHLMPANVLDRLPVPTGLRRLASAIIWRNLTSAYSRAGIVTSPTPRAADLLHTHTGLDILAVSNGVDTRRFHREPATGGVPTVLFVGRLDPEKHVEDALEAIALLPAEVPGRLEIVGEGCAGPGWKALARKLGLGPDRVVFRGRIDDDALLDAYRRADLLCMPSTAELQSLVTLEAMACGLPVVAADAMALPHLVRHGVNGYLYPPGDREALAGYLATLLRDAPLRAEMGARSLRIVEDHGLDRTLDAFEGCYQRLCRVTEPVAP